MVRVRNGEERCRCGGEAKHAHSTDLGWNCDACELKEVRGYLDERTEQLRSVVYALDSRPDGMFWRDIVSASLKKIDENKQTLENTLERERAALATAEMFRKESERYWKRIQMLEHERGPGLSAPQPIKTCDVGADWED